MKRKLTDEEAAFIESIPEWIARLEASKGSFDAVNKVLRELSLSITKAMGPGFSKDLYHRYLGIQRING